MHKSDQTINIGSTNDAPNQIKPNAPAKAMGKPRAADVPTACRMGTTHFGLNKGRIKLPAADTKMADKIPMKRQQTLVYKQAVVVCRVFLDWGKTAFFDRH